MISEPDHVERCPAKGCDIRFVGATPDEVRRHAVEEHGPLYDLLVFEGDS